MNAKGSKNAIENRGAKSVMKCTVCGGERKPMRVMSLKSNGMGYECGCGLLTKNGTKIDL